MIEIHEESVIREILRDHTFIPIDIAGVLSALGAGVNQDFTKLVSRAPSIPFFATGLKHRDLRLALGGFFRPGNIERWRPTMKSRAESVIMALSGKTNVCLVEEFSFPLLLGFMSDLLGLRPLEHVSARELLRDLEVLIKPVPSISQVAKAQSSLEILFENILEVHPKENNGLPETLYGHLVKHTNDHSTLTREDLGILVASCFMPTSVTANTLHNMLHFLLKGPDGLRAIAQHEWVKRHLDKLIRNNTALALVARLATADRKIGKYDLRAGDVVDLLIAHASQDPNECPAHETVPSSHRRHLVFGTGAHICPGSYIARMMLEEALLAAGRGLSHAVLVEPVNLIRRRQTKTIVNLFVNIPLSC